MIVLPSRSRASASSAFALVVGERHRQSSSDHLVASHGAGVVVLRTDVALVDSGRSPRGARSSMRMSRMMAHRCLLSNNVQRWWRSGVEGGRQAATSSGRSVGASGAVSSRPPSGLADQQDAVCVSPRGFGTTTLRFHSSCSTSPAGDAVPRHLGVVVLIGDQVGDDVPGPRAASCGRKPPKTGLFARLICSASAVLRESARGASGAQLVAQRGQLRAQLGDLALELGDAGLGGGWERGRPGAGRVGERPVGARMRRRAQATVGVAVVPASSSPPSSCA